MTHQVTHEAAIEASLTAASATSLKLLTAESPVLVIRLERYVAYAPHTCFISARCAALKQYF